MNLKQIAQKLGGYIQSKTQDDEGFIRQGKFTAQPIKQAVQNWQNKPSNQLVNRVVQSQPVQNFASGLKQSPVYNFGQTIGKTISSPFVFKTLQQNTQQYQQNINTALKMANQAKTQEDKQKWLNLAKSSQSLLEKQTGNVQQEYNKTPLQITGEGLGTAATLIGGPKLTPKTALTMAGISGGLSKVSGGSFAQGAGTGLAYAPVYAGISQLTNPLLSKVVGLTPVKAKVGERIVSGLSNVGQGIVSDISTGQKTTPLSMGIDLATGIVGGKEQFDTGVKVKGMTDQVFTQDKNIVNEARQILKFNTDTPDQLDKLRDTMKVLAKKYELTSQPNWNKFTLEKQYEILSNQMDEMAKNWANVSMGITDQPIKTGETIKLKETPKVKVSGMAIEQPELKQRGFSVSVQEAPNVSKKVKTQVLGGYEVKPNDVLMGEAKALLSEGVDLKNINKIENIDQKIAATIQEAINLDAAGKHKEAAALFNNLSELGTQVGRGTQAFSLLNKMSPEAISLSVAGKIKKYNLTHNKKLPELTGEQQKQLSKQVNEALKFPVGSKERGIALGKVNETINSFIPSTFADKFITVWKAGLLSSLRTHERNIVGNVIMQGSEQASLYPAAGADWLMSLATGKRSLVASQKGTVKGALEGGQTAADVIKYGFDPSGTEIGKYETKKVTWGNNPVEQALKKATDVVFNTLEAEDKVFWKSSYNRSLYNQAATEALNQGKKGDAKFIQQLFDNATEQMKQTAFNDANYATFKDKNMLSGAIGQLKSWVNRQTGPAAEAGKIVSEMLMPFTGVPTSIVGKTVAYSPIGLVKGSVDFGRVVAGSEVPGLQRQAAQEIGRGVIGSGIFGLGAYLMSQGLMTGQAKDQKERDQWALEGKQENSVLVNGKWRNIGSVGPQTLVLLAGAKANETANDPEQNLGSYAFGTLNDQLNQTFLSGVQQPLSALNEPYKAKSYLGGQVSSLIPNIVKDTSKAFDPLAREVDTSTIGSSIKGRVQQSIPGLRNKMIPQRDVLGNEIAQTPTGIGAYFDLFNSTTPISNNVVDELSRLNQAGYNKTPTRLDKNQTIGGEKMTLNQAQLDRLEIVTGLATDKALNDLFNTTAYQSLDDAEKQDAIGDVITKTRKNVRAKINLKNIEEKSYTTSSDSQLAELGGFGMFTKSVTTNPKSAINALLTGNPIRKISDGNIVVLERQNDIGSYDLGDTTSQVDHIIPLSLGGTNEVRNLQILTNEEHAIKTKTDMYLLNQVQSGQMSLKDAQEKAKNWRDTALSLPKNAQSQIIDEIDSESPEKQSDGSKVYKLVSDAGNVTLVDLGTPIQQPEYTGFDAIDKKLKSSYKSAITKRINNIVKLYEDGQLSATEANKLIGELNTQYSSGTGTKKAKKITFKVTSPKALPKITLKISSPVSRVKLKSAPKVKLSTSSNRKYTIKA